MCLFNTILMTNNFFWWENCCSTDTSDEYREPVRLDAQRSSEEPSASNTDSKVLSFSDCGVSSRPVWGAVSNSGDRVVNEKSFQFKLVNNIGMSHPETLEDSDLNNDLVNTILPSSYSGPKLTHL